MFDSSITSLIKSQALFESIPLAILIIDRKGQIVFLNQETEILSGYDNAEFLLKGIECLITPQCREAFFKFLKEYLDNPQLRLIGSGFDLLGYNKEGKQFPIEMVFNPILSKEAMYSLVMVRDITAYAQDETVMSLFSHVFALIELIQDIPLQHDFEKMLKLFVDGARKIIHAKYCVLGLITQNGEHLLKNYFISSSSKEEQKRSHDLPILDHGFIKDLLSSKKILSVSNVSDYKGELPENHPIEINIIGVPIATTNALYGFLYFADKCDSDEFKNIDLCLIEILAKNIAIYCENTNLYDIVQKHAANLQVMITEKERINNELLASETLFTQFTENIDEVFWRSAPDLSQVIYVSPAFKKIWGKTTQELYENPLIWFDSILFEDRKKVRDTYLNSAQAGLIANEEYRIRRPDGSVRHIFDRSFPLFDQNGRLTSIIGIATDVTEQYQLREKALLNDKLTTIGTLAAGVAHEINNPISWILSNLKLIRDKVDTLKQQELKEIIDESIQGADRIHNIVRNLKGFARIDDNDVEPIEVHEVLNAAIDMAITTIKYRARIIRDYDYNIPDISSNSGKLHQIFLNVILNAAQSIPAGHVEKNTIKIQTTRLSNVLVIEISDTGCGISPENLPQIFNPFFTTKISEMGSGLGLAICYDIVNSLGGRIDVKSAINKGTTFSIYLPLTKGKPIQKNIKKQSQPGTVLRKNILIVDDEPLILKGYQRILKDYHQITTVLGGEAAIEFLDQNGDPFDLIITDLSMPNVTGQDIYYFVKNKYPGRERLILFTTGTYSPGSIHFLEKVESKCLEKPFSLETLILAINEYGDLKDKG